MNSIASNVECKGSLRFTDEMVPDEEYKCCMGKKFVANEQGNTKNCCLVIKDLTRLLLFL